jgi:hypothetical protein
MSTNRNWVPLRLNLIGQISLYLIPAMIVFIFFPACLFTYFEGWDYSISVYYSFVTLTTIGKQKKWEAVTRMMRIVTFLLCYTGFGDYVPTFQPHQERTYGIYFVFYQIFILVWFITGKRELTRLSTYSAFLANFERRVAHSFQMRKASPIFQSQNEAKFEFFTFIFVICRSWLSRDDCWIPDQVSFSLLWNVWIFISALLTSGDWGVNE